MGKRRGRHARRIRRAQERNKHKKNNKFEVIPEEEPIVVESKPPVTLTEAQLKKARVTKLVQECRAVVPVELGIAQIMNLPQDVASDEDVMAAILEIKGHDKGI